MAGREGEVSARHALTNDEVRFCRMFMAFGEKNMTEAYARSFLVIEGKEAYHRDERGKRTGLPVPRKEISREGALVLRKEHIQRYIAELKSTPSEAARDTLSDHVRFGDPTDALRAANRILDDEDKLGFRDAAEKWAEIMCEVGAEVVVPLPGKVKGSVYCPHCFAQHDVELAIEATVPMAKMFPKFDPALAAKEASGDQKGKKGVQGRLVERKAPVEKAEDKSRG
jgi:hypothetical protein